MTKKTLLSAIILSVLLVGIGAVINTVKAAPLGGGTVGGCHMNGWYGLDESGFWKTGYFTDCPSNL